MLLFGLVGTSRHLAVSPTSASAVTLAASVAPLAAGSGGPLRGPRFRDCGAGRGAVLRRREVPRLGFLSDFIARSVLKGFTFGLALTIISRQLPKLLGTHPTAPDFLPRIVSGVHDRQRSARADGATVVGRPAVPVPRRAEHWQGATGAVVPGAGFAIGEWLPAERYGILTVGAQMAGVPLPGVPDRGLTRHVALLPAAFGVELLLSSSRWLGADVRLARRVRSGPNRDIRDWPWPVSAARSRMASSLAEGCRRPQRITGRSADAARGRRGGGAPVLSLVAFLPYCSHLAESILGAIVVHAVWHLLDVRTLREIARSAPVDHRRARGAVGVSSSGSSGLLIAVTFSLVLLMQRISFPRFSVLGRLPGTGLREHGPITRTPNRCLACSSSAPTAWSSSRTRTACAWPCSTTSGRRWPTPACVIIDNEMVPDLDMTSVGLPCRCCSRASARDGIVLRLARVREPVWEMLKRTGLAARDRSREPLLDDERRGRCAAAGPTDRRARRRAGVIRRVAPFRLVEAD